MAEKIASIIKRYSIYGLTAHSLFERDHELSEELKKHGLDIATDIILKAKGLEYSCVIWSSRVRADTNLEQQEFAYTIFTRTSSILIIAVFDPIDAELKDITKHFEPRKSIYWDQETSEHMQTIVGIEHLAEESDEDLTETLEEITEGNDDLDQYIE